jgi:hypothetical protein
VTTRRRDGRTGCDQTEVSLKGQGKGRQRTVEGKRERTKEDKKGRERRRVIVGAVRRRSGDLQDIQSAPWSPKRSKDQSYEVRRGHQKREAGETKRRDGLQGCRSDIPPCQERGRDLSHEVGDGAAIVEEEAPPEMTHSSDKHPKVRHCPY